MHPSAGDRSRRVFTRTALRHTTHGVLSRCESFCTSTLSPERTTKETPSPWRAYTRFFLISQPAHQKSTDGPRTSPLPVWGLPKNVRGRSTKFGYMGLDKVKQASL